MHRKFLFDLHCKGYFSAPHFARPLSVERYGNLGSPGNGFVLLRIRNNLKANNGGFGLPSTTTHLHNGHTPLESDGFPLLLHGTRPVLRSSLPERPCRGELDASWQGRH